MSALYTITFSGDLRDGFEPEQVKARFAARFALKPAQLAQMFSGRAIILKKGLPADQARRYVAELEAMGLQTRARAAEPPPPPPPPPAATDGGYRIVFAGRILPGFSREAVIRAAASRLHFDARQQAMLFSGKPITMKRGLGEDKARTYVSTLRGMGMDVSTDPALPRPAAAEAAHDEATEASLLQTQFSPAAPYNFEHTFHSSSSLDMLRSADDDLPPMPDAANPALGHARSALMQTIINPEAMREYEAALSDDAELSALRAAHDAPASPKRRVPPTPVDFDFTAPPVARPAPAAVSKPAPAPRAVPPAEPRPQPQVPPAPPPTDATLPPAEARPTDAAPPVPPSRTSRTGTLMAVLVVAVLVALGLFYLGGG